MFNPHFFPHSNLPGPMNNGSKYVCLVKIWPGVLAHWPGVLAHWPGAHWPGVLAHWPGVFAYWPGVFAHWPGVFAHWPGVLAHWPGVLAHWPGVLPHWPGVLAHYETQKNILFFSKERKRTPRKQHSFAKNGKERKKSNILLQRTEKNARTFRSFAKESENVPFFFLDIYRYI